MSDRNPAPMPSICELLVQVTVDLNAERQRAEAAEARLEELERERDEWMHGARLSAARNVFAEARLDRQQAVIEAAHVLREAGQYGRAGAEAAEHRLFLALAALTQEEPGE